MIDIRTGQKDEGGECATVLDLEVKAENLYPGVQIGAHWHQAKACGLKSQSKGQQVLKLAQL